MELQKRKPNRLKNYDYGQCGAYFITVCTKNRQPILSKISQTVGNAVLGIPKTELYKYGQITERIILQMQDFYSNIHIDYFVIMPNHLHLILSIKESNGAPRTAHPTVSSFIGTLKRFINREIGKNIWQTSFYDHIIRDDTDYITKAQYIQDNPAKWLDDELFTESITA